MTGTIKTKTPKFKLIIPLFNIATWHDYIEENFRAIDALFYNLFDIQNYKGAWKNVTDYVIDDVVFIPEDYEVDENGQLKTNEQGDLIKSKYSGRMVKVLINHTTDNSEYFSQYYYNHQDEYELFADASTSQKFAQEAKNSELQAQQHAETAADQVQLAKDQVDLAKNYAEQAKNDAAQQVELCKEQVQLAKDEVTKAKQEVTNAQEQVQLAANEVDKAKNEVNNAKEQVTLAEDQANLAKQYADNAKVSENNAHTSEINAQIILDRLGTVIKIKGRVDSLIDLPLIGNLDGDVYLVGEEGLDSYPEYYWYQNHWEFLGTSTTSLEWGNITGNITKQTDLQTALDAKQDKGNYITSTLLIKEW